MPCHRYCVTRTVSYCTTATCADSNYRFRALPYHVSYLVATYLYGVHTARYYLTLPYSLAHSRLALLHSEDAIGGHVTEDATVATNHKD